MTPLTILDRSCGPCKECCIIPSLEEMNKKADENCRYLCSTGCSIYSERPDTCRNFLCLWKVGQVKEGEEYRPNNLGLMFTATAKNTLIGGQFIIASETRENAHEEVLAKSVISEFAKVTLIVLRKYRSNKTIPIGPISLVRLYQNTYEVDYFLK